MPTQRPQKGQTTPWAQPIGDGAWCHSLSQVQQQVRCTHCRPPKRVSRPWRSASATPIVATDLTTQPTDSRRVDRHGAYRNANVRLSALGRSPGHAGAAYRSDMYLLLVARPISRALAISAHPGVTDGMSCSQTSFGSGASAWRDSLSVAASCYASDMQADATQHAASVDGPWAVRTLVGGSDAKCSASMRQSVKRINGVTHPYVPSLAFRHVQTLTVVSASTGIALDAANGIMCV